MPPLGRGGDDSITVELGGTTLLVGIDAIGEAGGCKSPAGINCFKPGCVPCNGGGKASPFAGGRIDDTATDRLAGALAPGGGDSGIIAELAPGNVAAWIVPPVKLGCCEAVSAMVGRVGVFSDTGDGVPFSELGSDG